MSGWLVARGGVSRLALLAVAVGLGSAGLRPQEPGPWVAATCLIAAALVAAAAAHAGSGPDRGFLRSAGPILVIALGLASGLAVGSIRTAALLEGELARSCAASGAWFDGQVVVTGMPALRGGSIAMTARSLGPAGSGEELLLELLHPSAGGAAAALGSPLLDEVEEGLILRVEGRLRAPVTSQEGGGEGGFDEGAWLRRMGIAAVLEVPAGSVETAGRRGGAAGMLDHLRSRARGHLVRGLEPDMAGMLRGFILGDKSGIPPATLEAFRRAGTAHLLAVSGLHVGSLAAVVILVARVLGAPPGLRTAGAGGTVALFMLLTGAGPSVVRATVMVVVVLCAGLAGRGRDGWTALALAAVAVLAREPPAIGAAGFQLSFSAAAALLLLARPLERRLSRRLPKVLATGVGVSLAASIGTAPVSLFTFDQVSLVGVAANPLVVPVVPVVMAFGLASVVVGFVWPGACGVLNLAAGTVIGWVTTVSAAFGAAPVLTRESMVTFFGAAAGGLLAWVGRRKCPGPRRAEPQVGGGRGERPDRLPRFVVMGVGIVLGAGVVTGASAAAGRAETWLAARSWPSVGEVRVLDAGEGAAVLVRSPGRAAVLIDAGPPHLDLAAALRRLGVARLDVLVITHPHADHYGGLSELSGGTGPRLLVDHVLEGSEAPVQADEAGAYLALREEVMRGSPRHLVPEAGDALEVGDVRLEFLAPPAPLAPRAAGGWGVAGSGRDAHAAAGDEGGELSSARVNRASLVVVVRVGGLVILVPGDAEADALARYQLPDVDVMVVPHHGSAGAVTEPLLDRLTPAVAVVPVGAENSFGHPAPGTLEVLRERGVEVFGTHESGWVALRPGAGHAVEVMVER